MLATARAMEDVNIRHALLGIRLARVDRLNLVTRCVAAARSKLLVMLQSLAVVIGDEMFDLLDRDALAGDDVSHLDWLLHDLADGNSHASTPDGLATKGRRIERFGVGLGRMML
jgi:hypothetical protein